jgi:hypothetical protein
MTAFCAKRLVVHDLRRIVVKPGQFSIGLGLGDAPGRDRLL